jgi:hypothetical protein
MGKLLLQSSILVAKMVNKNLNPRIDAGLIRVDRRNPSLKLFDRDLRQTDEAISSWSAAKALKKEHVMATPMQGAASAHIPLASSVIAVTNIARLLPRMARLGLSPSRASSLQLSSIEPLCRQLIRNKGEFANEYGCPTTAATI